MASVPGALERPFRGVEHQVEALLHVLLALVERQLVHAAAERVGDLKQTGTTSQSIAGYISQHDAFNAWLAACASSHTTHADSNHI